jgi:hypothetical protein
LAHVVTDSEHRMLVAVDVNCGQCGKRFWQFGRYSSGPGAALFVKGIQRAGMTNAPPELGMQPGDAVRLECRACGYVPPPLPRSRIVEWLDSVKPDADGYGIIRVPW